MIPHIVVSYAVFFYVRMVILAAITAIVAIRIDRRYRFNLLKNEFVKQLHITYFYEGDAE